MATNFEPHECVIFAQSTKIGTHENKAIHCTYICVIWKPDLFWLKIYNQGQNLPKEKTDLAE